MARASKASSHDSVQFAPSEYIALPGQIVDAILVAALRQRNANDENKTSKKCDIPDGCKSQRSCAKEVTRVGR